MEFGIVYSCLEDKMYTGRKGKGAFCNGQKLHVSHQEGRFTLWFLAWFIPCTRTVTLELSKAYWLISVSVFSVLSHRDRGCGCGRGGWGGKGVGADGVSTGLRLCQGTWRSQSAPTLTAALGHCFSPRVSDSFYNSSALMPLGLVISKLKGKRPFKLGIIKNET